MKQLDPENFVKARFQEVEQCEKVDKKMERARGALRGSQEVIRTNLNAELPR